MGGNGGIIGPANIPAASGFSSVASGVWSLTEAQENNSGGKWPEMPPTTYDIFWLVIAGGAAGGGATQGGGGGAGGYRSAWNSETSGGGGSAESAISVDNLNGGAEDVNSGVTLTCTIGAGAAGSYHADGNDSTIAGTGFTTLTSVAGGGGGSYYGGAPAPTGSGKAGGSGGGAGNRTGAVGGAATSNQGYAGGTNNGYSPPYPASGGGGAAAVGGPAGAGPQTGIGGHQRPIQVQLIPAVEAVE